MHEDWVEVCKVEDLPPGEYTVIETGGTFIAVFNVDGEFHALEDICTHDGAELTGGQVQDGEIVCPRHGSRFCIKTGEALSPPAYEPTLVFPTRVEGDIVQVRDNRWD